MLLRETGRPVRAPSEISMMREVLPSMTDTRAGRTTKSSISVGNGEAGVSGGCVMEEGQGECNVTILPRTPQKTLQNDDAAKAHDLKRRARDIARDSHGIEDEIRAMVSSYMAPNADEDPELVIGRLVC